MSSVLCGLKANIRNPDQTPQYFASDLGLKCFVAVCFIKILIKMKNTTNTPVKDNAPVQLIKVGNSIRHKCVKSIIFIVMLCAIYIYYRFREACMF